MSYRLTWSEIPLQQYNSLPPGVQKRVSDAIERILDDPTGQGRYDKTTDRWTATFDDVMILYVVSHAHVSVVILRIFAL